MKITTYSLIILIITSRGTRYDKQIKIFWETFNNHIKKHNYPIKIFYIIGKDTTLDNLGCDNNDIIVSNIPEKYNLIADKTLYSLQYIEDNYDYKHVFRTNLSSFLILDKLMKYHDQLPSKNLYYGIAVPKLRYISGAGFWLSRDVINKLLKHKDNKEYNKNIDDIWFGNFIYQYYDNLTNKNLIDIKPHIRYDINDNNTNDNNILMHANNIKNKNHYHIRINPYIIFSEDFLQKLTNHFYNQGSNIKFGGKKYIQKYILN
jgi:hypothetical protein